MTTGGTAGSKSSAQGTFTASAPIPIHVFPPIVNDFTTMFPTVTGLYSQLNFAPFTPPSVAVDACTSRAMTPTEFAAWYTSLLAAIPGGYDYAWVAMRQSVPATVSGRSPGLTGVVQAGLMYRIKNTFGIWSGQSWTMVWPPRPHYVPEMFLGTTYRTPGRDDGKG